jgi:hypothetical protein
MIGFLAKIYIQKYGTKYHFLTFLGGRSGGLIGSFSIEPSDLRDSNGIRRGGTLGGIVGADSVLSRPTSCLGCRGGSTGNRSVLEPFDLCSGSSFIEVIPVLGGNIICFCEGRFANGGGTAGGCSGGVGVGSERNIGGGGKEGGSGSSSCSVFSSGTSTGSFHTSWFVIGKVGECGMVAMGVAGTSTPPMDEIEVVDCLLPVVPNFDCPPALIPGDFKDKSFDLG